MTTRHGRLGLAWPWGRRVAVSGAVIASMLVVAASFVHDRHDEVQASPVAQARTIAPAAAHPTGSPAPAPASSAVGASASAAKSAVQASAATDAAVGAAIAKLTAGQPAGGVSVAAVNLETGANYGYGADAGMNTGSIVKLDILETLLWQDQKAGTQLSGDQVATATRMIENSDNDAAEDLFETIGGRSALLAANPSLGVSSLTVPGPGDYWGLTTTSAGDQITLLHNLVATGGALSSASQQFVLGLMRGVEADQRWGVGVVADTGTSFANKNGWLAVDDDNDLWLVNSLGVLSVHGQTVLMAVLTQHDSSFDAGIALVQALAQATVPAVTS
jgi:hypothetical protein